MIDKIFSLNTTNPTVNIVQNVSDSSDATHQTEHQTSLTRTIIVFDQNTDKSSISNNNQSNVKELQSLRFEWKPTKKKEKRQ